MWVGLEVSAHTGVEKLHNVKKWRDVHDEAQGVCCILCRPAYEFDMSAGYQCTTQQRSGFILLLCVA